MAEIIDINTAISNDLKDEIDRIIKILNDLEQFETEWNEGALEDDILNLASKLETKVSYSKELETLYNLCQKKEEVNNEVGQFLARAIS